MCVSALPKPSVKRWRVIVFGIVAALLTLVFLLVFFAATLYEPCDARHTSPGNSV